MPENVRTAPDRSDRAQACLVEHVEHAQVRIDGLCALDVEDRGERAGRKARADVRCAPADRHLALRIALDAQEQGRHLQRDLLGARQFELGRQRNVVLRLCHHLVDAGIVGGWHEDGEEAAGEAPGPHARQVEMACILTVQECLFGVAAAAAQEPQQDVVVAVEYRHQ